MRSKTFPTKDENIITILGLSTRYGYGEGSHRFITYSFPFEHFSEHINIEEYKTKISSFIKSVKFTEINDNCKIGLILFVMPKNGDEPYQKEDINKFCVENHINFVCKDTFVDN